MACNTADGEGTMELKGFQRSYLVKLAHNIKPSVMLGSKGLTEQLSKQTEVMLEQHELVKVKFIDYKKSRQELSEQLCRTVDAELVRIIGNVAILYRHAREPVHRNISLPEKK